MKLLIVDDEELTRTGVITSLDWASLGIDEVLQADDGVHGLETARRCKPEIILCDVRMPRMDGISMLERLEKILPDTVPIFMSGYSDKEYLKAAIKLKAVNYIEKPFSLIVLKTRIDALIKKYYGSIEKFIYKNIEINFTSYTAKIEGRSIEINPKELKILKCLLNHEGQVLSRMQIIDQVWKETDDIPYDRVIDVYIKELRKKLHLDCITTIRNVGYKLERK